MESEEPAFAIIYFRVDGLSSMSLSDGMDKRGGREERTKKGLCL